MTKIKHAACLLGLGFILCWPLYPSLADEPSRLQTVADSVAKDWPSLHHVGPADAAALIKNGSAAVFDVRSEQEYAVSHVPGAVRVDPNLDKAAFLQTYAESIKGKTAIFYCAVGVRSSKLAERVGEDAIKQAGGAGSLNVKGGIFAWSSEGLPLENANGKTDLVHGYDATWGKLVRDQSKLATEPAK